MASSCAHDVQHVDRRAGHRNTPNQPKTPFLTLGSMYAEENEVVKRYGSRHILGSAER